MVRYAAAEKGANPDLMTRFREEHYDTKAHRAWAKVQRTDNEGGEVLGDEGRAERALDAERRTLRSEWFKKEQAKHPQDASKAQRRLAWRDPGFG